MSWSIAVSLLKGDLLGLQDSLRPANYFPFTVVMLQQARCHLQAALFKTVITNPFIVKVCSHTSKYRGAIITIEKHQDRDGTLSLHTTIDGQLFHPTANDSFNSILKDCRVQIDHVLRNEPF
jgi:hypothetical protein